MQKILQTLFRQNLFKKIKTDKMFTKLNYLNNKYFFKYLLLLIAFFIPINNHIVSYLIGALVTIWILEGDYRNKIQNILSKPYTLLFAGYYIIYLIGILYSENLKFGMFDLGIKVSLLIFPILFSSLEQNFFKNLKLPLILNIYLSGCLLGSLICLANATYQYYKDSCYTGNFYYTNFSILFHPGYFSMYLNFAIAILAFLIIKRSTFSIQNSYKSFLLILFFSVIIVLLSSKAGLVTLIIIIITIIGYLVIRNKKYKAGIILCIIIMPIMIVLLKVFPNSLERMNNTRKLFMNKAYTNNLSEDETSGRILIWKTSLKVMKENPIFGVGTGDVKDVLLNTYKKLNIKSAYEKKLNAHNQYFQTFIATGIIGFLILWLGLLLPAMIAFKQNNIIYLLFIIIFGFNILVESMLEVQAGVVFYGFFNSRLFYSWKTDS